MESFFTAFCFFLSITAQPGGAILSPALPPEEPVSVLATPVEFSGYSGVPLRVAEPQEVRIGFFMPEDRGASDGNAILYAAQMAIDECNAAGGYDGFPFRLVQRWAYDPWGAGSKEMISLAYRDSVWAVIGSVDGDATHIAEQIATKAWLPLLSPLSADPTLNYIRIPWMFRFPPDYQVQATLLAEEGIKASSMSKVGVITAIDHDGRIFAQEMSEALLRLHIPPQFHLELASSAVDYRAISRRIRDFDVQAIIVHAQPSQVRALLARLARDGCSVPVLIPWIPGLTTEDMHCYSGIIHYIEPFSKIENARYERFVVTYRERYGDTPSDGAAYVYDAVHFLARSIQESGLHRAKIRAALARIDDFKGVTGKILWDNGGGNRAQPVLRVLQKGAPDVGRTP